MSPAAGVRFGYAAVDGGVQSLPRRLEGQTVDSYISSLSPMERVAFRQVCSDIGLDQETVFQAMAVGP